MDAGYGAQSREKFRPLQRARKPSSPESSPGSNSVRPLLPIENYGTPRTPPSFSLHEASPTEQRLSGKRSVVQQSTIPSATPRIRSKLTPLALSRHSQHPDRPIPVASTSHNFPSANNPFLAKIDSLNTPTASYADFSDENALNATSPGNAFESSRTGKDSQDVVSRRGKENVLVCVR